MTVVRSEDLNLAIPSNILIQAQGANKPRGVEVELLCSSHLKPLVSGKASEKLHCPSCEKLQTPT